MTMNFDIPGRKHGQTAVQAMDLYQELLNAPLGKIFILATPYKTVQVTVTDVAKVKP